MPASEVAAERRRAPRPTMTDGRPSICSSPSPPLPLRGAPSRIAAAASKRKAMRWKKCSLQLRVSCRTLQHRCGGGCPVVRRAIARQPAAPRRSHASHPVLSAARAARKVASSAFIAAAPAAPGHSSRICLHRLRLKCMYAIESSQLARIAVSSSDGQSHGPSGSLRSSAGGAALMLPTAAGLWAARAAGALAKVLPAPRVAEHERVPQNAPRPRGEVLRRALKERGPFTLRPPREADAGQIHQEARRVFCSSRGVLFPGRDGEEARRRRAPRLFGRSHEFRITQQRPHQRALAHVASPSDGDLRDVAVGQLIIQNFGRHVAGVAAEDRLARCVF